MTIEIPGRRITEPAPLPSGGSAPAPLYPFPVPGEQFAAAGSRDFFSTGITVSNANVPRYRNTFSMREVRRNGRGVGVWEWELTIWDFRGGLNATWGDFNSIPNRMSSASAVYTHIPGHLTLSYVVNTSNNTSVADIKGYHHYNIFSTMALGVGSAANNCLFTATTGAPSARTFTVNGGSITCLAGIIIGGNTSAERLVVGCSGGVGEILSDLAATPTSSGDMHANTNPLWGVIPTGLPDPSGTAAFVNLLYANGNIYRMLTTDAIGAAPTSTNTPAPNGGFALGVSKASGLARAYWVWPKETTAAGMLSNSALGYIWSTNLEGSDAQKLDIALSNGLRHACLWQDGIAYTDDYQIFWYRGGKNYNLGWQRERQAGVASGGLAAASTAVYCVGLMPRVSKLIAMVAVVSGSNYYTFLEYFDPDDWSWHPWSEQYIDTNSGVTWFLPAGAIPYSEDGEVAHFFTTDSTLGLIMLRQRQPRENENEMFRNRGTFTSGSGEVLSPVWTLPGLIGVPSVVESVRFGGYLNSAWLSGNTSTADSQVTFDIYSQSKDVPTTTGALTTIFYERDRADSRYREFPDNMDAFTYLQIRARLAQAGTNATYTTPNGVPFVVKGLAFPDGKVRSPREVRGR